MLIQDVPNGAQFEIFDNDGNRHTFKKTGQSHGGFFVKRLDHWPSKLLWQGRGLRETRTINIWHADRDVIVFCDPLAAELESAFS